MVVSSVSEVLKMDKDDPIICVTGTVLKVSEQETKKNAKGDEYTLQFLTLTDTKKKNVEIGVSVFDHDEIPSKAKGKQVWIYGHKGKGCFVDEYKDKIKIKVTKAGTIDNQDPAGSGGGGAGDPGEPDEPQARTRDASDDDQAPDDLKPQRQAEKPADDRFKALIKIRRHYLKRVNCFRLAMDASLYLVKNYLEAHGVKWDKESEADFSMLIAKEACKTSFTTLLLSLKQDSRDQNLADEMPVVEINDLLEQIQNAKSEKE